VIVMLLVGGGHLAHLGDGGRPIDQQALLVVTAMVALDEGVLVGAVGRTDGDGDAQAGPEAHEGRGKVARFGAADEARIAVEGDVVGQPLVPHQVGDGPRQRLL